MKKTYITPSMKALKIETSSLLDVSGPGYTGGDDSNDKTLDSKAFNSGIWGSMNSNDNDNYKATNEDEE